MVTAKIQTPNYGIYGSDPVQQIYARGSLDRDTGGLAYMFKNAADRERRASVDSYESGVREANAMSQALAQRELEQERAIALLKASAGLMEKGMAPSGFKAAGELFNDPNGNDAYSQAIIAKLLSEAAQNNSSAANAGADKYEYRMDTSPGGVTTGTWVGKGKNPNVLQAEIERRVQAEMRARGLTPNKNGPLALPGSAQEQAAAIKRQAQRYGNVE